MFGAEQGWYNDPGKWFCPAADHHLPTDAAVKWPCTHTPNRGYTVQCSTQCIPERQHRCSDRPLLAPADMHEALVFFWCVCLSVNWVCVRLLSVLRRRTNEHVFCVLPTCVYWSLISDVLVATQPGGRGHTDFRPPAFCQTPLAFLSSGSDPLDLCCRNC